jgi:hypothetical protein
MVLTSGLKKGIELNSERVIYAGEGSEFCAYFVIPV